MGAHILVVDDDPLLAAALRRPLAYLGKPFAFEELLVRIKALLRRGRNGSTSAELRFGDVRMDRSTREVWRGERTITLTRQEFDLLALFLEHPRQVLPRSNVLEVYVGYLRRKLEAEGEPRVIHTVRGVGYVLRDDPEAGR